VIPSNNIATVEPSSEDVVHAAATGETARAGTYRLLALLLGDNPGKDVLDIVAGLPYSDTPIGQNIGELAARAQRVTPAAVAREYHNLFVGLGGGELIPYGSYYLSGFLHEKPLARLRADLRKLGIERDSRVGEPEDGIASICEVMSGLIAGDFGIPADLSIQKDFFTKHLGSWGTQFFIDLESAKSADFYRAVGALGRVFLRLEVEAFSIEF
jgi:TorA maturation chaperone TorD